MGVKYDSGGDDGVDEIAAGAVEGACEYAAGVSVDEEDFFFAGRYAEGVGAVDEEGFAWE